MRSWTPFWNRYGVTLLNAKSITPGDIYTVFFSVTISTFALGSMLPFLSSIALAYGSGNVVREAITCMPNIDPYSETGFQPDKMYGRIKFQDVTFAYPSRPDNPVFQNFTLDVWGGETIGTSVKSSGHCISQASIPGLYS
jgi:ATP-binding cassette subfamily B (MDR/TAP) protein 1